MYSEVTRHVRESTVAVCWCRVQTLGGLNCWHWYCPSFSTAFFPKHVLTLVHADLELMQSSCPGLCHSTEKLT